MATPQLEQKNNLFLFSLITIFYSNSYLSSLKSILMVLLISLKKLALVAYLLKLHILILLLNFICLEILPLVKRLLLLLLFLFLSILPLTFLSIFSLIVIMPSKIVFNPIRLLSSHPTILNYLKTRLLFHNNHLIKIASHCNIHGNDYADLLAAKSRQFIHELNCNSLIELQQSLIFHFQSFYTHLLTNFFIPPLTH